ncbi:MAG: uncharacterized protein H6Q90_45 [Deltaproteobacteria bacterium]|nr:uncharacterized protein [Deltaproteobacteria bacterium]
MLRTASLVLVLAACASPHAAAVPDARVTPDVDDGSVDAASDARGGVPLAGFGDLAGMCGILGEPELGGATPQLFRDTLTFSRRFDDPADRPLLTAGGLHMIETPNAGGSSVFSEVFAYEQLARCELASLLKTETEIVYDTPGKLTDLEVAVDGHKIGVSVTRAMTFPFGQPYTTAAATTLIQRKLEDIQVATTNVSAQDRWDKQVLAILAFDDQHADMVMQVWNGFDASVRADTIVLVTVTHGDDTFIYTDQ